MLKIFKLVPVLLMAVPLSVQPQQPSPGRWMAVASNGPLPMTILIGPAATVQTLAFDEFESGRYELQPARLVILGTQGTADGKEWADTLQISLAGDTLKTLPLHVVAVCRPDLRCRPQRLTNDRARDYVRVGSQPQGSDPIRGTWREAGAPRPFFLTLRSDGRALIEGSGAFLFEKLAGDTLETIIRPPVGPEHRNWYRFLQTGDTLWLTGEFGNRGGYVRRPWGCFGRPALDGGVAECR